MKRFAQLLCLVGLSWLSGLIAADDLPEMQARIVAQQQAADRHRYDQPRDAARKPFETFVFLGVQAGMTVLDVGAYAGYTTEMLAAAVGPTGWVYSHNTENVLFNYAQGYYKLTMDERLANNRLPNVVLHVTEYDQMGLEGKIDVAFLGNLLHDFYYKEGRAKAVRYLEAIATALKPAGVLGLTDHVGVEGQDNRNLHRIEPRLVRELLNEAGFTIAAESDLLENPDDNHLLAVYDEKIYRQTDRVLIKAVKREN